MEQPFKVLHASRQFLYTARLSLSREGLLQPDPTLELGRGRKRGLILAGLVASGRSK